MHKVTFGDLVEQYKQQANWPAFEHEEEEVLEMSLPLASIRGTDKASAVDQGEWLKLYTDFNSAQITPDKSNTLDHSENGIRLDAADCLPIVNRQSYLTQNWCSEFRILPAGAIAAMLVLAISSLWLSEYFDHGKTVLIGNDTLQSAAHINPSSEQILSRIKRQHANISKILALSLKARQPQYSNNILASVGAESVPGSIVSKFDWGPVTDTIVASAAGFSDTYTFTFPSYDKPVTSFAYGRPSTFQKGRFEAVEISISNEFSSSGGFILPNDRVDVIMTHDNGKNNDNNHSATTILKNIRVLSIDQVTTKDNSEEAVVIIETATLALNHKQIKILEAARKVSDILTLKLNSLGGAYNANRCITNCDFIFTGQVRSQH